MRLGIGGQNGLTETATAERGGPNLGQMFRNIGGSLIVSALLPYIAYRLSAPYYPHDSVIPLLISTIFPALGLAWAVIKNRSVDAIAVISIAELVATIVVTLWSSNVEWALIARASQAAITGLVFGFTALIGRPIVYYIARQFVIGEDASRVAGFDRAHVLDKGRAFTIATYVWTIGLVLMSALSITLAASLDHATYLLVAPILSVTINVALVAWSIRYTSRRLMRYRDQAA